MNREEASFILANIDRRVCDDELNEALDMAIKVLEQEQYYKDLAKSYEKTINKLTKAIAEQEPCGDAISRQAVLDLVNEDWKYEGLEPHVESLPPVTPQPKTGHWIEKDGFDGDTYYDCSECGESWTTIEGNPWNNGMKYCPNCGAKMVEPQERSDK